jgi:hypothetical protein
MTVLYVVLGLVGFFVITGVIAVWMFLHSETGQKIISTAGKSITLMQEATKAPGTPELRARGCTTALVIPFDKIAETFREFAPDMDREIDRRTLPGDGTMIMCQIATAEATAPALSCTDVARTYIDAVPQVPERFGVTVQRGNKEVCNGSYGRDGAFIAPLNMHKRQPQTDTPVEQGDR